MMTGRYGYLSGVDTSTQAATRVNLSSYATPNVKSGNLTNTSGGIMSLNLTLNKNLQSNPGGQYGSSLYNKQNSIT
jgi:hypothetical protein